MGSASEITEPTTGTEKNHQPIENEEVEDEQVFELERKTASFHQHAKRRDSVGSSTITTNTSPSSSFSGDGIPDVSHVEEGEHTGTENSDVPESPEKETEIGFHDEGNNCIVYFDGEQGSESAGVEPEVQDSHTEDLLKVVEKTENGSTSEDTKGSREIEEIQDAVDQPAAVVIEEEVEIGNVEDYDVEKVLDKQETHDLICPNCNACITKRVILKRRKRKISHELEDPKRPRGQSQETEPLLRSEDNMPPGVEGGGEESTRCESFLFKCLSCFSIFTSKGVGSKPLPPSETVEGLQSQTKPLDEAKSDSSWFSSMFGFNKIGAPVQQGGGTSSVPGANPLRDNLNLPRENATGSTADTLSKSPSTALDNATGFTSDTPSKSPATALDNTATSTQDGPQTIASKDKQPIDTLVIQDGTTSKAVNNGTAVETGQKFLVPSSKEDQTQQHINKDEASLAVGNYSSEKGSLSPIPPSHDMNISSIVTTRPDGGVSVETIFHAEGGVSHHFEGTDGSVTRKPDFGVTGTGDRRVDIDPPSPGIEILPESSPVEGSLTEPLVRPPAVRPFAEGRGIEIIKSIVYGGLIESVTSLGVISSAAGSGASTLNILVLGLANLFGGLILIIHHLQELREDDPSKRTTTEVNQERGRYKRLLGKRKNFTLHATVAILSFIIAGLLPPVVYYFSFSKSNNKDYKVASVFGASLLCIVLLSIAKAHVKTPRGSYYKSALYYAMIAVSVSGISYVVGNFVDQLLEKYGWADGGETPPVGHMMVSLLGRKAGSFGHATPSF